MSVSDEVISSIHSFYDAGTFTGRCTGSKDGSVRKSLRRENPKKTDYGKVHIGLWIDRVVYGRMGAGSAFSVIRTPFAGVNRAIQYLMRIWRDQRDHKEI